MDTDASHQLHHLPESSSPAGHDPHHQLQNHHPHTSYLEHDSHPTPHDYGAYAANNHHSFQPPSGRFTEEWDASQRGSSIIDGHRPNNKLAMQRTASISSYAAGDDANLPIRNNTLRKKGSVRRAGSLGRSASRRSNRAGSVRSLALQSSSDRDEGHSAFYCPVPTSGNPTIILAERFQSKLHTVRCIAPHRLLARPHCATSSPPTVKSHPIRHSG